MDGRDAPKLGRIQTPDRMGRTRQQLPRRKCRKRTAAGWTNADLEESVGTLELIAEIQLNREYAVADRNVQSREGRADLNIAAVEHGELEIVIAACGRPRGVKASLITECRTLGTHRRAEKEHQDHDAKIK